MQNKGAIIFLAVALALVSVYQLSFTWVSNGIVSDAVEYSNGDKAMEQWYLDSMANQPVYNFLGVKDFTLRECQERELNMGLDLKGGMNVVLEVSVTDLIRSLANYNADETFNKAIELASEKQKDSQDDFITLFGQAFAELDADARLAAIFSTYELKERITTTSTNEEVISVIREETQSAIDNSFNILRTRIDRFGVSQPNIQRVGLENSGRILVELPGVKDPERVKKLLQGSANLEFWETYDNEDVYPYLESANKKLSELLALEAGNEVKEPVTDQANEDVNQTENETVQADSTATEELSLVDQLDTDSVTTADPFAKFSKSNPLFAVLPPAANAQGQLIGGAMVGTSLSKDTAAVNSYLNRKEIKDVFPRNLRFFWEVKPFVDTKGNEYFNLVAIKVNNREGLPALSGDAITNARPEFGGTGGQARVTMSMNGEGAKVWARLTRENIGKQVAVVLDDYVYTYPTVQGEIKGGSSEITGNFTIEEAQDLANILKSGKLPAPARIIQEEIVGPTLGQESIDAGMSSFIIAFFVVLLYMLFYYNKAGIAANLALMANLFFIFGVLASLGAVLTLPGIAGIVLTIGMSVDANVLIFERIREEIQAGKGLSLAVSDGYKNAYSAIIDANVTTLLTGIILFIFGTGPIKGFATTLVIGIITSLFAAIFLTRLVFLWYLNRNKEISFATKLTEGAFKNTNVDFLGKRKVAYIISGLIIIGGFVSLITRGLNESVDFTGGRTYIVRFDEAVSTTDVQAALKVVYGEAPAVVTFGGEDQVKITTQYRIDESGPEVSEDTDKQLYEGLKPVIGSDVTFEDFYSNYRQKTDLVGPSIADDIKTSAAWAIIFSLLIIFLYILARFRMWQFGLGALAALAHDVLIVLGLFSLLHGVLPFSLEIDQAFIAAILTVIGYSINDTVVVFDRIREYIGLHKREERGTVYNLALNSTLSRTFSTSLSTFFVLFTIFVFGGEVIRGFIFALLIGVVVGTYSSLFIATPVAFDTLKKQAEVVEKKKRKK